LVAEAEANGVVIRDKFTLDESGTQVSQAALERLSSTRTPQSPVAVIEIPQRPFTPGRSVLVAWDISDPGNLGAMIRSAAGFGLDFMTTEDSVDLWSPKVLRAAAGGHFHTGLGPAVLDGLTQVAAVQQGGVHPRRVPPGQVAVLIGSEAHGLPSEIVAAAHHRVSIPMPGGIESLNAAAAAAILCYEVAERNLSDVLSESS